MGPGAGAVTLCCLIALRGFHGQETVGGTFQNKQFGRFKWRALLSGAATSPTLPLCPTRDPNPPRPPVSHLEATWLSD